MARRLTLGMCALGSLPLLQPGFRFSFTGFMSTEADRLLWKSEGLPADELSIENAIMMLNGRRVSGRRARGPNSGFTNEVGAKTPLQFPSLHSKAPGSLGVGDPGRGEGEGGWGSQQTPFRRRSDPLQLEHFYRD